MRASTNSDRPHDVHDPWRPIASCLRRATSTRATRAESSMVCREDGAGIQAGQAYSDDIAAEAVIGSWPDLPRFGAQFIVIRQHVPWSVISLMISSATTCTRVLAMLCHELVQIAARACVETRRLGADPKAIHQIHQFTTALPHILAWLKILHSQETARNSLGISKPCEIQTRTEPENLRRQNPAWSNGGSGFASSKTTKCLRVPARACACQASSTVSD